MKAHFHLFLIFTKTNGNSDHNWNTVDTGSGMALQSQRTSMSVTFWGSSEQSEVQWHKFLSTVYLVSWNPFSLDEKKAAPSFTHALDSVCISKHIPSVLFLTLKHCHCFCANPSSSCLCLFFFTWVFIMLLTGCLIQYPVFLAFHCPGNFVPCFCTFQLYCHSSYFWLPH